MRDFSLKEDSSIFPIFIFPEQDHIIFIGLFFEIFNLLPCYPIDEYNNWLYSMLKEEEFNITKTFFGTSTCLGNTNISMTTFCIPSVINSNRRRGWNLFHLVSHVRGGITILASWVFLTKIITIFSKNHVGKLW